MNPLVINDNGDYVLTDNDGTKIRSTSSTVLYVDSNTENAIIEVGYGDNNDVFSAIANGFISNQNIVNHGRGTKLMVRVSGIISGTVTIIFKEGN